MHIIKRGVVLKQHNISSKDKSSLFRPCGLLFISLMMMLLLSSAASAATTITVPPPETLVVGDVISIAGYAEPNSDLAAVTMYTVTVDVDEGEYEYVLNNIRVPSGTDTFVVEAEDVENLGITVKKFGIPFSLSENDDDEDGIVRLGSSMVPPATYKVTMSGQSTDASVNIEMKATSTIETNATGYFECSYKTSTVPAGIFTIDIGDDTFVVELLSHKEAGPANSNKKSSSHTGTELSIVPADSLGKKVSDEGKNPGENGELDEQDEQFQSPVEEPVPEPEEPVENEAVTAPQMSSFQKLTGWMKKLFN